VTSVFERIYRNNRWHGTESLSGPGSGTAPTKVASRWLRDIVDQHGVTSVLDIGCGDATWQPLLPGYLGIDVAPTAVARAQARHPDREFRVQDAVAGLPTKHFDMVVMRDVLQHLSFKDGFRLMRNVGVMAPRFMVASTYTGTSERYPRDPLNVDIRTGDCYCNDLTAPPWSLPHPLARCMDGWDYETGEVQRDRSKWLALWRIAVPDGA
jgi:SAM-dependent methyltransferase